MTAAPSLRLSDAVRLLTGRPLRIGDPEQIAAVRLVERAERYAQFLLGENNPAALEAGPELYEDAVALATAGFQLQLVGALESEPPGLPVDDPVGLVRPRCRNGGATW